MAPGSGPRGRRQWSPVMTRQTGGIATFPYRKGAFDRLTSPLTVLSDYKPGW